MRPNYLVHIVADLLSRQRQAQFIEQ
ncbi:hypothetical protein F383_17911 [Gossypium arboreum]|uniref:Uncharacterized protein n=1 Tax=Gossypium arboreum TaxID=29729 RepID=A0A0B0NL06_GOSAR|nr:hypothetical protein F383_17911 [Gossypium arboreum]